MSGCDMCKTSIFAHSTPNFHHQTPNASMKAMLLAAGLGTRLKPWTDKHPKALAIVNNKSLLQRNIEYLVSYGFDEIVVNVHHFADQVTEALKQHQNWGAKIIISDETDKVLETGGGLKKAAPYLADSPCFLLMNVDILTDIDLHSLLHQHTQSKDIATLAVSERESSRYFLFDENEKLCGWKNTKTGEEKIARYTKDQHAKAFSGMHIINPAIFDLMPQTGKFSMVDVYLQLAKSYTIGCFEHTGAKFIDVGKPESIEKASLLFA